MRRRIVPWFLLGFVVGFALTLFLVPSSREEAVQAAPDAPAMTTRTLRVWSEDGGVPLRSQPSWTEGRILAVLPNGTHVVWGGVQENGFVQVVVPSLRRSGWVQTLPFEYENDR